MTTVIEREHAIERVKAACAWDQTPTVTEYVVEDAVDAAARPDGHGNPVQPIDDPDRAWWPTYDLNAACARVWEAKAAQAASRFDLTIDGQNLNRAQLIAHCNQMADRYRARTAGTIPRNGTGAAGSAVSRFGVL